MGNIQSAVLERATRAQETSEEEMRTLRYAVREELKNLAEDPSQRTLYKLLHTEPRKDVGAQGEGSGTQAAREETKKEEVATGPSVDGLRISRDSGPEDNSSLPGSPRLIIDETVDPQMTGQYNSDNTNNPAVSGQGKELPRDLKSPGVSDDKMAAGKETAEDSVGAPSRPRIGSMSQSGHKHPKKMFLEDYTRNSSGSPSGDSLENRARTASFSVAGPGGNTGDDFRNRTQSVSAVYSLKKRVIAAEKAKQGERAGKEEPGMKTVNIRTCINAILESQMVRNRLKVPPEEMSYSENSQSPQNMETGTRESSPTPLKPHDIQRQISKAMCSDSESGETSRSDSRPPSLPGNRGDSGNSRPSSRDKKPATAANVGEMGIHGPLLMLAAQVDSMRPLPVDKHESALATETQSPTQSPIVPEPPRKHMSPAPRVEAEDIALQRRPEPERYPAQRVATIRPITQPPRIPQLPAVAAAPIKPAAAIARPPEPREVSSIDCSIEVRNPFEDQGGASRGSREVMRPVPSEAKMPGLVPHPQQLQVKGDRPVPLEDTVRYYEQTYRDMLTREIQKVYAQEYVRPETGAVMPPPVSTSEHIDRRIHPDVRHPVAMESRYEERGVVKQPGRDTEVHWSYHPQTAQEREDIIRESRRTLTFHEARRDGIVECPRPKYPHHVAPPDGRASHHRDRSPMSRDRSPLPSERSVPPVDGEFSQTTRAEATDVPLDLSAKSSSSATADMARKAEKDGGEWNRKSPLMKLSSEIAEQPILVSDAVKLPYPPPPTGAQMLAARPATMVYLAPGAVHPRHVAMPGPVRPQIRAMIQQQQHAKVDSPPMLPAKAQPIRAERPAIGPQRTQPVPPAIATATAPSRLTVGSLLGDHSPNDILYLRCNLCASTYGSLHAFRKHFSKAHGHDPSAEHITIQTISATKDAIDKAKSSGPQEPVIQDTPRFVDLSQEKQQALEHLNLLPSNQYYESQLSRYKISRVGDNIGESARRSPYSETFRGHSPPALSPQLGHHETAPPREHSRGSPAITHHTTEKMSPLGSPVDPGQMAIIAEKSSLKCPQCNQEFSTRDWGVFRRHVRAHETAGEGLNKCATCREMFQDEQQWQVHLATAHTSGPAPGQVACRLCGILFPHVEALSRHHHTVHAPTREAEAEYRCHFCSKSFVHESGLIVHMQEHTAEIKAAKREKDLPHHQPYTPPKTLPTLTEETAVKRGGRPQELVKSEPIGDVSGVATMYTRRMSFSENMHRDFKRPTSRDGEDHIDHTKRPRSGSFPNALDFLERKVEFEHKRLLASHAEGSQPHKVLKMERGGSSHTDHHGNQQMPSKRSLQESESQAVEKKRSRLGPGEEEARFVPQKPPPHLTARSLIDEMVETAVSEIAASPSVVPSPPLKILPRLFKGDPLEKVWMHEGKDGTAQVEGGKEPARPSVSHPSSKAAEQTMPNQQIQGHAQMARTLHSKVAPQQTLVPGPSPISSQQMVYKLGQQPPHPQGQGHTASQGQAPSDNEQRAAMENFVKQAMLTMPFLAAKKPENVKDIIESLVTMEISTAGVPGMRRVEESAERDVVPTKPPPKESAHLSPKEIPVEAREKPQGGSQTDTQKPQKGEKMETIRETISQAIEKSISFHLSHEPRDDHNMSSRLRQLMTEKPCLKVERDMPKETSTASVAKPCQSTEDTKPKAPMVEEGKDGTGLQSMREICDQIIAKSLTSFEVPKDTGFLPKNVEPWGRSTGKVDQSPASSQKESVPHRDYQPRNSEQMPKEPMTRENGARDMDIKHSNGDNNPRDNVPRENIPRDNVPKDNIPRDNVPQDKDKFPRDNVPRNKDNVPNDTVSVHGVPVSSVGREPTEWPSQARNVPSAVKPQVKSDSSSLRKDSDGPRHPKEWDPRFKHTQNAAAEAKQELAISPEYRLTSPSASRRTSLGSPLASPEHRHHPTHSPGGSTSRSHSTEEEGHSVTMATEDAKMVQTAEVNKPGGDQIQS